MNKFTSMKALYITKSAWNWLTTSSALSGMIITSQIDAQKATNIKHNRSILKSLTNAVLFCGRQCIALQGDAENT